MDSTGSEQGVLMFHMFYILFIVYVEALRWADPPSSESHGVTNCVTVSELKMKLNQHHSIHYNFINR